MKKYTIIMNIILGMVILIICLACTFFDPAMAAGKRLNIFWIDENAALFHISSDKPGEVHEIPVAHFPEAIPTSLAIDSHENRIYWAFSTIDDVQIRRVNFDGSDEILVRLFEDSTDPIESMAIDPGEQMLYFSETTKILRIPAGGDGDIEEVYNNTEDPNPVTDIALDLSSSVIYFVQAVGEFKRKGMFDPAVDYAETVPITDYPSILQEIALNTNNGRIYWTDGSGIYSAPYENGGEYIDVTTDCFLVLDLVSVSKMDYVYWADDGGDPPPVPRGIYRVNIGETGEREEVCLLPSQSIKHLAIDILP